MDDHHSKVQERLGALCGAIFLFGLAFLIRYDLFWRGILPLILITAMPLAILESGVVFGLWILAQTAIWLIGLPLLYMAHFLWPGILVLGGLSALLVAIAPPDKLQARGAAERPQRLAALSGQKVKRKRRLPDVDEADDEDEDTLAALVAHEEDHRQVRRDQR